jgi:hypothetical protein
MKDLENAWRHGVAWIADIMQRMRTILKGVEGGLWQHSLVLPNRHNRPRPLGEANKGGTRNLLQLEAERNANAESQETEPLVLLANSEFSFN